MALLFVMISVGFLALTGSSRDVVNGASILGVDEIVLLDCPQANKKTVIKVMATMTKQAGACDALKLLYLQMGSLGFTLLRIPSYGANALPKFCSEKEVR